MENASTSIKTLHGIQAFITTLPTVHLGTNAIANVKIEGYGAGQIAFDTLKDEYNNLDFSKLLAGSELANKIKKQKNELEALEQKHASLVSIFGEDGSASEGTLTHKMLKSLDEEIESLITKRDHLLNTVNQAEADLESKLVEISSAVTKAENDLKIKLGEINGKVKDAELNASQQISQAAVKASSKVRIIEQFSDFLAETNTNMSLYFYVIIFLVIGVAAAIGFSIPNLLKSFESYDAYITLLGVNATSWQILNFAFGILIVKLPWALCLSAVFTGLYKLLKGLLLTYEKINQDKRNMSAIYAVSGNIAETLNDYGMSIAEHDHEDMDSGEMYTVLRAPNKLINQKRESLKWNQIMNYFERMQVHVNDVEIPEDPSKIQLVTDVCNKLIDRIPTTTT